MPRETQATLARSAGRPGPATGARVVETADRLERDLLAGCIAHPELVETLGEISAEAFRDGSNRAIRDHLVAGSAAEGSVVTVLAELDARAARDAIDERTTRQLLLRLEERMLRRELDQAVQSEAPEIAGELRASLGRVQDAIRELG